MHGLVAGRAAFVSAALALALTSAFLFLGWLVAGRAATTDAFASGQAAVRGLVAVGGLVAVRGLVAGRAAFTCAAFADFLDLLDFLMG